ncbi:hypothetical protein AMS59_04535 [Lysinibacillus sp. FJAT-14745]|uniref:hypothetical protein n=1 Tax=Lysinibacillus sp. FJAT-14745 TaxID=1704289 RepID=UPI0006ABA9B4|nr:hypothetical protein [Lysinibacillus sp. FJAT-14745]KOP80646.1 hypothetical protein AMS59_04535 [Lysinibacillus sp. FJAT-14745]
MSEFKEILTIIPILTIFSFLVAFMKLIVNFINANEIDKLLRTPWKKFVDSIAISLVFSFFIICIMMSEIFSEELKFEIITYPKDFLFLIITLVILITIIILVIGNFLSQLTNILWSKKYYYIINDKNEEWVIEKALDNNRIYIKRDDKIKILSDLDNVEFRKVIVPNEKVEKIFNYLDKFKKFKMISLALFFILISVISGLFVFECNNKFLVAPILIIVTVVLLILVQGYNDYLASRQNNQTEQE